jgi:16S rRNA (cytidine1402-2'-O)-methyltransferase
MEEALEEGTELPSGLYIIATPIGNIGDITLRAIDVLGKVEAIVCEDTRETGKLTSIYDLSAHKIPYHDHNADEVRPKIINLIKQGHAVALVSDAGMPLVSDPGYKLVEACYAEGLMVTCIPGASASLTALVLSGLPSDRFMFAGFLPPKGAARRAALNEIKDVPGTLIFYETAPRLLDSLGDMKEILGDRPAAVARELTKKFEEVRRDSFSALISHYEKSGQPKGEIVIVVGPAGQDAEKSWAEGDIDTHLRRMMSKEGMSVKDAAGFVAAKSGWKKSDVYQRALLLKQDK